MKLSGLVGILSECVDTRIMYVGEDGCQHTKISSTWYLPAVKLDGINNQTLLLKDFESDEIVGGCVGGYNKEEGLFTKTLNLGGN